ncbi:Hippocalcin-like protein 1 [Echinococcus granulosus]|nr:Hippocalcin-like protein 1 [Echinococcus granulosus]
MFSGLRYAKLIFATPIHLKMGAKQAKLKAETIDELTRSTPFNEQEIQLWYRGFLKDCPNGQLTVEDFQRLYCALFSSSTLNGDRHGDPRPFARLVFRAFDQNGDGVVEFRDIITTLSVTRYPNDEEQRLRWAFHIYDLDGDGYISRGEMLQVVKAIYKMIGPATVAREMPAEEATPEQRTRRLFAVMDKDGDERISFADFVEGVRADAEVLALLGAPCAFVVAPSPSSTTPELQPTSLLPIETNQNGQR